MLLPAILVTRKRLNITFMHKFPALFTRNKNKFGNKLGNHSNKPTKVFVSLCLQWMRLLILDNLNLYVQCILIIVNVFSYDPRFSTFRCLKFIIKILMILLV